MRSVSSAPRRRRPLLSMLGLSVVLASCTAPARAQPSFLDKEVQLEEVRGLTLVEVTGRLHELTGADFLMENKLVHRILTIQPGPGSLGRVLEEIAEDVGCELEELSGGALLLTLPEAVPETSWLGTSTARKNPADPGPPYEDVSDLMESFPDDDLGYDETPGASSGLEQEVRLPDLTDVEIGALMGTLEKMSGVEIRVDPRHARRTVSGTLERVTLRQAIERLARGLGLKVGYPEEGVITLGM